MAAPLKTGKQSVNLAKDGVRVSRIRRDPPPIAEKISARDADPDEVDKRAMLIGITAFALSLFVILFAVTTWGGASFRSVVFDL